MNLINIFTRTCNRPNFFALCKKSLSEQSYTNWLHIIGYDDEESYTSYLHDIQNDQTICVPLLKELVTPINTFPYNLYFNVLQQKINSGYIIYLDDDDGFYVNNALEIISKYLDEDTILIWRVKFPDGLRPSDTIFANKRITSSGFPSNCFCYHSKWATTWTGKKGGDSVYFHNLCKKIPKKIWLNEVLTKVNQSTLISGKGKKTDIIM